MDDLNAPGCVQYSIVVPICNEQATLPELERRLVALFAQLDGPCEVILVDDGSTDASRGIMAELANRDPRFKVLGLSRNFGHQAAITAGLDVAVGEAVIVMDGDLQDPPEVIVDMVERWRAGYDIVYAVRQVREDEPWGRKLRAAIFYRLLRRLTATDIPADVGDFRLVDRRALEAFKAMREGNRYIRGMFSWVGFSQTSIQYVRAGRFAGETKYPLRKLIKLALDGVLSFSDVPLRLALRIGFALSAMAFLVGAGAIAAKLLGLYDLPGIASITVLVSLLGGIQLTLIGLQGQYIARIHDEVKQRPLYIVSELWNLEPPLFPPGRALIQPRRRSSPEPTKIESRAPLGS